MTKTLVGRITFFLRVAVEMAKESKQSSDVQPELVAATNDSSIKSKRSMVRLGYFDDKFGRAFVSHPSRRSPLINRFAVYLLTPNH